MHTGHHASLAALLALLAGGARAQQEVDLDKVDSAPAPSAARHPGMKLGDVSLNLFFDASLEYVKSKDPAQKGTLAFGQEHNSLLARAATSEGIVAFADVIHPENVFEVTVPLRFLTEAVDGIPGLSKATLRGGRILVPFGDFPAHALYGGSVRNSEVVKDKFWSDYGASLRLPFGERLEAELYAVDGLRPTTDSTVILGSQGYETNFGKDFGGRLKFYPSATTSLAASYYHGSLTSPPRSSRGDSAFGIAVHALGLDAGLRTGPVGWKAGGMYGKVLSDGFGDYAMSSWYAESRLRLSERWALRLRGGQADPDNRVKDADDQTDVNLGVLWQKGPLDVALTAFHNWQTGKASSKASVANFDRIRLETFVSL